MTVATCFDYTLTLSGPDMVGGHSIGFIQGITLVKICYVIYTNCMYDNSGSLLKQHRKKEKKNIQIYFLSFQLLERL